MKKKPVMIFLALAAALAGLAAVRGQEKAAPAQPRNIVIFVSDGLRSGSVNAEDAPTYYSVRTQGVYFANSHSLFPTFTTANASAIATGHYLGDTGDFSNTIFTGLPEYWGGAFGKPPGTFTPYIENDAALADLNSQFHGNYLNEETLLSAARERGFNTAAIGKMGPAAIQDVSQLSEVGGRFAMPQTVIIDDGTGTPDGAPLAPEMAAALIGAGLPTTTPVRDQPTGNNVTPGTKEPNTRQQAFFADATTRAVLPMFKKNGKPFVLLYWSRDPDGTQHFQGDSLNTLVPGINGPTSRAGLKNADNNLKQIMDYIHADPQLSANTDIFLTADHGFATISKHEIDAEGQVTASYSAKCVYRDIHGRQEVNTGFLPQGFLAIDLAHALDLPLFDPSSQIAGPDGKKVFEPVDPTIAQQTASIRQYPAAGNGLIGGTGRIAEHTDARVVVAANGGSDLIYLPSRDPDLVRKIVNILAEQDYVDGIFVNDEYGIVPGALPSSAIRLVGASPLPSPTIAVAFKTFSTDPKNPIMTGVQISDYNLQQGQGMHGSFGRANTFNFMAAIGPDFKKHFVDPAPISNADVAPTLARILGLELPSHGKLVGRVLREALAGGPASVSFSHHTGISASSSNGKKTILMYQKAGEQVYFDRACLASGAGKSPRAKCP